MVIDHPGGILGMDEKYPPLIYKEKLITLSPFSRCKFGNVKDISSGCCAIDLFDCSVIRNINEAATTNMIFFIMAP